MGFFSLQDGKDARTNNSGAFALEGGGDFEPIPAKTKVKAVIEDIAWDENPSDFDNDPGVAFIKVRWSVLSPSEYKNRKIFPKLWVSSVGQPSNKDPHGKRSRDIAMLAAINANCPGQPLSKLEHAPNDEDLRKLNGTICLLDLDVWESDKSGKKGNWVRGIEAATAAPAVTPARRQAAPAQAAPAQQQPQQSQPATQQQPVQQQQEMPNTADSYDDEIPF